MSKRSVLTVLFALPVLLFSAPRAAVTGPVIVFFDVLPGTSGPHPFPVIVGCRAVGAQSYTLSFGDGESETNGTGVFTHTYQRPGSYTVTCTARDAGGGTAERTTYITVTDEEGIPISGSISCGYSFASGKTVYIGVFNEDGDGDDKPIAVGYIENFSNGSSYTAYVSESGTYWIGAFMDLNGDVEPQTNEPTGDVEDIQVGSSGAENVDISLYAGGDVDTDWDIDVDDALLVAEYAVGALEQIQDDYADVDCNDRVSALDALLIARQGLGLQNPVYDCD